MISSILKERTKEQHDETEAKLQSKKIFDKSYTIDDYKNLLSQNYKLISVFEPQIYQKLGKYKNLKLEKRLKTNAIKMDLENLNVSTDLDFSDNEILENEAEAFGALYVIEGSTLGGNVIVKHLKKNPDFETIDFNYFGIYGENTGPFWQEFKSIIDEKILEEHYEQCVIGAKKAYKLLS